MTGLEPPLLALRETIGEIVPDLRKRALAIDTAPADMAAHLGSPAFRAICDATVPKRFRSGPTVFDQFETRSYLARIVATVELSRGDPGVLTASPGPSLAGVVVDALGSEEQREMFYRAVADGPLWTFFAMTEPDRGSDGTAVETTLTKSESGDYTLVGAKRYISNGARGAIGVVFARTGPSPLSLRAALIRQPAPGLTSRPLDMLGLRGAYLSELRFDGVRVPAGMVLGSHLPLSRRGTWGIARTFNIMRIHIGAMAIGLAYAAYDYVASCLPGAPGHHMQAARLDAARQLLYDAAAAADKDPDDAYRPSVAKLHCTALAIGVLRWAVVALGPGSLLAHPLLEKWRRDAYAFEFMDGTTNVQRLRIARTVETARSQR
ncbi:acyl-CoA dehydrogenase [Micromonospora sonchi]|uniref:Acyl-CoA dehydrogenase n=1 Tax=Micromonospora sonchi TaxID=1763543 RepID=A0A917U696_9ACTN|nr:acyl-CoA dehydrogenase family protein [Micromonospora sonchi]GGM61258.1 acyl-CoA dehydrogenase [Micromonospora sonchi]